MKEMKHLVMCDRVKYSIWFLFTNAKGMLTIVIAIIGFL